MHKSLECVIEALCEDARSKGGPGFDATGWANYFPEEYHEYAVKEAFDDYRNIRAGRESLMDVIAYYAKLG